MEGIDKVQGNEEEDPPPEEAVSKLGGWKREC
jgi:hypothetical protein